MGITRGLIRVGIALPVLRGIATRLWGGHCEVCGREDAKENSQSDDRLRDTFSTAAPDSYAFHREAFRAFEEPPESFDDVIGAGLVLCGSPATVARQLQEQIDTVGLRQVCLLFAFGNLPHEKVMRSLRLFSSEVMPALRT